RKSVRRHVPERGRLRRGFFLHPARLRVLMTVAVVRGPPGWATGRAGSPAVENSFTGRRQGLPMLHVRLLAVVLLACAPIGRLRAQESKPLVFEGRLSKDDPPDAVRKGSGHKVHEVKLEAGQCYQIDLTSKDFDTFLRLEDDNKKQLAF